MLHGISSTKQCTTQVVKTNIFVIHNILYILHPMVDVMLMFGTEVYRLHHPFLYRISSVLTVRPLKFFGWETILSFLGFGPAHFRVQLMLVSGSVFFYHSKALGSDTVQGAPGWGFWLVTRKRQLCGREIQVGEIFQFGHDTTIIYWQ